jgi:hypothetical protein
VIGQLSHHWQEYVHTRFPIMLEKTLQIKKMVGIIALLAKDIDNKIGADHDDTP